MSCTTVYTYMCTVPTSAYTEQPRSSHFIPTENRLTPGIIPIASPVPPNPGDIPGTSQGLLLRVWLLNCWIWIFRRVNTVGGLPAEMIAHFWIWILRRVDRCCCRILLLTAEITEQAVTAPASSNQHLDCTSTVGGGGVSPCP